jgi:uncharacterized membrane protein YfcA
MSLALVALSAPKAIILVVVSAIAGVFNGVAGGAGLLIFPTLLAVGVPALPANVTATVGLVPSYLGTVAGLRDEVIQQRRRFFELTPSIVLGAATGATLLLAFPASTFRAIVPWLIIAATILFALQPIILRRLGRLAEHHPAHKGLLFVGTFLIAIYGGYFGSAMGIMLLALWGLLLDESLNALTALRSALSVVLTALCAVIFIFSGHVDFTAAACVAAGSLVGGWAGSHVVRRLHPTLFRVTVAVIGIVTSALLLFR